MWGKQARTPELGGFCGRWTRGKLVKTIWETRLEVYCAMPQGTVTHAERSALEAVKATVSIVRHGEVRFNLDGQVLGKPTVFSRTRSLDTEQRDNRDR